MTTAFYICTFVSWIVLAAIWSKKDLGNTAVKVAMFLMAAWSGFYVYSAFAGAY